MTKFNITKFGKFLILIAIAGFASSSFATEITVSISDGQENSLARTMLTLTNTSQEEGYSLAEHSFFTDDAGRAAINVQDIQNMSMRARKAGYVDVDVHLSKDTFQYAITLQEQSDTAERAEQIPANAWVSALDFGDADFKEHFRLQCSFCHQQGSPIVRLDRTEEEWEKIINRMLRYGSRLDSEAQKKLPALIRAEYLRLNENPATIPSVKPWGEEVIGAQITEWPLGDGSSQLHDILLSSTGLIYVGDNLQDNLIMLDPKTGRTVTHKIPRKKRDKLGGNIGGRLKNYPGVGTYVGLHSLDESNVDGHIFMTGSDSSRLVEFAPETGKFTLYDLKKGLYPHTIRIDQKDRVWFTMAVSNQVAMFDRKKKKFKFYKLPARSFKEATTIKLLPTLMKLSKLGVKTHKFSVDKDSTGLPLPYGIDIAPDGGIWFTRLHSNEIGHINPDTGKIDMYKTPFLGPRRLRTDAQGNIWITVFASGRLAKFTPDDKKFTLYDLPTLPLGSDTPYSLAVDKDRDQVWVNGTASDTMMRYDIKSATWAVFPLPRMRSFTRDVSIAKDGSVFTSNGSFPAWHIEDGQPTVIRIMPHDLDTTKPLVKSE
jgi:streptogramin lyase